ncbi:MAG: lysozyme [Alphaproteobacteria bacterium]|nr:lysozyme [Alphaproteobacteria bacterium]
MSLRDEMKEQRNAAFDQKTQDSFAAYRQAEQKMVATLVLFEGCSYESYKDIVNIDTIGIGNTKRPDGVKVGARDRIKDNEELLRYVSAHLERETYPCMKQAIKRELNENETAALVSLVYNCGPRVLWDKKRNKPTALAEAINANDKSRIEKEWMKYNYTRKGTDRGLTIRRAMEVGIMNGNIAPEELLVCTYGGVNLARIYRAGKLDKSAAAYQYIKDVCSKTPSPLMMKKYAYFNYGKPVGSFVKGLESSNSKDVALQQVAVRQNMARSL